MSTITDALLRKAQLLIMLGEEGEYEFTYEPATPVTFVKTYETRRFFGEYIISKGWQHSDYDYRKLCDACVQLDGITARVDVISSVKTPDPINTNRFTVSDSYGIVCTIDKRHAAKIRKSI